MKINWFSPVPPTPSAIALHNAAVLPALAKEAEITVWVYESSHSPALEEHARVVHYQPEKMPWPEINAADATIYHLGNNPHYHAPIWKVNRQHAGIVVLHDLGMQHFFGGLVHRNLGLTGDEYREMMGFYHPNGGAQLAEAFICGGRTADEISQHCSLMGAALENATAVAAHTQAGYDLVRSCSKLPAAYVPLFALPEDGVIPEIELAHRNRSQKDPYRLIIFGFLGPNRRLESVLKALNDPSLKARFRLEVYGTLFQEKSFQEIVSALDLGDTVRLHGFVPADELAAALSNSDLAINLRDPTMGEASASQLRIWQHSLPSLVSDTGWYATLPKDTVAIVRRRSEISDIQMHLREFIRDPERYREMGRNGKKNVEEHHTVDAYVHGLLTLVETTLNAGGREAVSWVSNRAGRVVRPWFAEDAAGLLLPPLARAISRMFDSKPIVRYSDGNRNGGGAPLKGSDEN